MAVSGKRSVDELDFLRGIAITMMIVNHVGVRMLNDDLRDSGALANLVSFGSFAPVVFFFTTGFGIGFAKNDINLDSFLSTFLKAGLLVVADQFLLWRIAIPWGLDFLSFIAISSVLVTTIAASRKPIWLCVTIIAGVLAMRFGLGAWFRERSDLPGFETWLVGARAIAQVSYPFSPWIIYPVVGFLLGRRYKSVRDMAMTFPGFRLYAAALGALACAAALHQIGAPFFRWGTMSFAYFVLSIGVLLSTFIFAWLFVKHWPRAAQPLFLRGISSLAIVPIHYALIELLADWGGVALKAPATLAAIGAISVSSVTLSRAFAGTVGIWLSHVSALVASVALASLIVLCAAICWISFEDTLKFAAFVVGQLAIAALLVVRIRRTTAPPFPKTVHP
jgi:Heparan-alpha-glucosaminide N-acetyltransferase, catalytic